MEDPLNPLAGGHDGAFVGHVSLDQLDARIVVVLGEIGTATDDEVVEYPNVSAVRDQAIDQMAADEARTTRYEITTGFLPHDAPLCPGKPLKLQ